MRVPVTVLVTVTLLVSMAVIEVVLDKPEVAVLLDVMTENRAVCCT